MYLLGAGYMVLGLYFLLGMRRRRPAGLLTGMGFLLMMFDLSRFLGNPVTRFGLGLKGRSEFLGDAFAQFGDYIKVLFQIPQPITMIAYIFVTAVILSSVDNRRRRVLGILALGLGGTLCFIGEPLAIIGTAYIIIAAFVVRSLPASVRAGVAALQQIDPSIDEASNSLGADAEYTFRKITLPLISPALLAGLIFSFTRHMTSLSAIIFLVSPRWRIVTASILSEWEQGGISFAAAYASVIIVLVLLAIGVLYFVVNRVLGRGGEVDLSLGA
jgi:iron(III) transport system permease protein